MEDQGVEYGIGIGALVADVVVTVGKTGKATTGASIAHETMVRWR